MTREDRISLEACFISPNVSDNNLEAANLVDTTDHIAFEIAKVAKALDRIGAALERLAPDPGPPF